MIIKHRLITEFEYEKYYWWTLNTDSACRWDEHMRTIPMPGKKVRAKKLLMSAKVTTGNGTVIAMPETYVMVINDELYVATSHDFEYMFYLMGKESRK